MNILITGANGFIGRNLTEFLAGIDSCVLFTPRSFELDVTNENDVDDFIRYNKIDIIIHAANRGGGSDKDGMTALVHINLRMFFNIIKNAPKVAKIINIGSGAEYQKHKPIVDVCEEDAYKALPLDDYGFCKAIESRYIEHIPNAYHLRVFGCYGKYENYKLRFISNSLIKNILHLPIEIVQNVIFDYIYINDLVNMIFYFVMNDGHYRSYNISRGDKIDLMTLAKIINDTGNFKSQISVKNHGLNNEYSSSNIRIMNEIGPFAFTPHVNAIRELYDYYSINMTAIDNAEIKADALAKLIKVA
ncbi:MAG: NAD(P)-dependent oxidoreductase [Syntrophobacteraceae bacterium]|jgi:GDP-L-fucose synthase